MRDSRGRRDKCWPFCPLLTITFGLVNVALLTEFTPRLILEGAAEPAALAMGLRFLSGRLVAQMRHPMPWLVALLPGGRRLGLFLGTLRHPSRSKTGP